MGDCALRYSAPGPMRRMEISPHKGKCRLGYAIATDVLRPQWATPHSSMGRQHRKETKKKQFGRGGVCVQRKDRLYGASA